MDFVLPLVFLPGLAVGSFLGVVAARVPLRRSVVHPGLGLHELRGADPLVRQRSRPLLRPAAGSLPPLRNPHPATRPRDRARDGAASSSAACSRSGSRPGQRRPAIACGALVVVTATDLERRDRPEPRRAAGCRRRARAEHGRGIRRRCGRSAPSAPAGFLFLAALAYPGGMGMGDVKLALLIGALLGRTTPVGIMLGLLPRARAERRPARPPRRRRPASSRSLSRPSSPPARWSRSSPASRSSTPTSES